VINEFLQKNNHTIARKIITANVVLKSIKKHTLWLIDNQEKVCLFLDAVLAFPQDFTSRIVEVLTVKNDKRRTFLVDHIFGKVAEIKSSDVNKNKKYCTTLKDIVTTIFHDYPSTFAMVSPPNIYAVLYFLMAYEFNTHSHLETFTPKFVAVLEKIKTEPSEDAIGRMNRCVAIIEAIAEMRLDQFGREHETKPIPKDEAFRIATLRLLYSAQIQRDSSSKIFVSSFVVDKSECFMKFLKSTVDPSLQLANSSYISSFIIKSFIEKGKLLVLVSEKSAWFASALDLIKNLNSIQENKSILSSIALNITLVFLNSIENTKDTSIKEEYYNQFVVLINQFTNDPNPSIRACALSENIPSDLPSLSIPGLSKETLITTRCERSLRPSWEFVSEWGGETWGDESSEWSGAAW